MSTLSSVHSVTCRELTFLQDVNNSGPFILSTDRYPEKIKVTRTVGTEISYKGQSGPRTLGVTSAPIVKK